MPERAGEQRRAEVNTPAGALAITRGPPVYRDPGRMATDDLDPVRENGEGRIREYIILLLLYLRLKLNALTAVCGMCTTYHVPRTQSSKKTRFCQNQNHK